MKKHFEITFAILLSVMIAVMPNLALAQQTGPAGTVLRVPSSGGRATMGALDLGSANATTGQLNASTKLNGLTSGTCLFGGTSGAINQEATSECYWDATGKSLSLGNSAPSASAKIQIDSTTKGFLIPRMTETQRNAISSPATGLQIFNTTTNKLNVYAGTSWSAVGSGSGSATNQLTNGSFEDGFGSPWQYNNAVTPVVNTGTGAGGAYDGTKYLTYNSAGGSVTGTLVWQNVSAWGLSGLPSEGAMRVRARTAGLEVCTDLTIANAQPICQSVPYSATAAKWEYVRANIISSGVSGTVYIRKAVAAPVDFDLDDGYLGIDRAVNSFIDGSPTNVQRFTIGSGTYVPSANTRYIRVKLIGGGSGGGSGHSTAVTVTNSGSGTSTTLGTLTALPGASANSANPGAGGGVTIPAPWLDVSSRGGSNGAAGQTFPVAAGFWVGATGPTSYFGGGASGGWAGAGANAPTASGCGGGGGGTNNGNVSHYSGGSGGCGGFIDAILVNPTSMAYSIGTGGAGAAAGTEGFAGGSGAGGQIVIEEYGYAGGTVYTPQTVTWKVDANIAGTGHINMGGTTVSSYTPLQSSSLVLTQNANSLSTGIACASGTNSVVGNTTCTSDEADGITFNVPLPGEAQACVDFGHTVDVGNSATLGNVEATFELVETPANANTILQRGKTRLPSKNQMLDPNNNSRSWQTNPLRLCGTFNFATAGQKTLRKMYTQLTAGTVTTNAVVADAASGAGGDRDIHWVVRPTNQAFLAPVMTGPAVTTVNVSGAYTTIPSDAVVNVNATSAAVPITLTAGTVPSQEITIRKTDTTGNLVTVTGSIDGVSRPTVIHTRESIKFQWDLTNSTWRWVSSPNRLETIGYGCSSSPSIGQQSGAWTSGTPVWNGSGKCTVTIATGVFYSRMLCVMNQGDANSGITSGAQMALNGVTSFQTTSVYNNAGTTTAQSLSNVYGFCEGNR